MAVELLPPETLTTPNSIRLMLQILSTKKSVHRVQDDHDSSFQHRTLAFAYYRLRRSRLANSFRALGSCGERRNASAYALAA